MFNFLREKFFCVNEAFSKRSLIKTKRELERCDRSGKQSFGSFRVIRPTAPEILFFFLLILSSSFQDVKYLSSLQPFYGMLDITPLPPKNFSVKKQGKLCVL